MNKLILIRHGQSLWNAENKFTGWVDSPLSEQGKLEAKKAGQYIRINKIKIDACFTSLLKRAINTLEIVLSESNIANQKIIKTWQLNERHYGSLTGHKKSEVKNHYQKEWIEEVLNVGDKKGINAMTISDLTGIPRPTVIRKLKILLKQNNIFKDDSNLYYVSKGKLLTELNKQRLINIKKLSTVISRINNIIFFS